MTLNYIPWRVCKYNRCFNYISSRNAVTAGAHLREQDGAGVWRQGVGSYYYVPIYMLFFNGES